MVTNKILVVSANLGGVDEAVEHEFQSIPFEYYQFTDDNFPIRKAFTPRLQSKLPKCFAYELKPHYDFYLWIDANLRLTHTDALKYLIEQLGDNDIVVLRHPRRPNIRQETRYIRKGLREKSIYLTSRYDNEFLKEQYRIVENDKDYIDDLLVIGGMFMYRNTPEVHKMLKEWWYYQTRYIIQDQLSFAYVLKKSGLKVKILDDSFNDCWYLAHEKHKDRTK